MCDHGQAVDVFVKIDASLAAEGVDTWKMKPIDPCISEIVTALQEGGIDMLGSCCGHQRGPGEILLADGRRLVIESESCPAGMPPSRCALDGCGPIAGRCRNHYDVYREVVHG